MTSLHSCQTAWWVPRCFRMKWRCFDRSQVSLWKIIRRYYIFTMCGLRGFFCCSVHQKCINWLAVFLFQLRILSASYHCIKLMVCFQFVSILPFPSRTDESTKSHHIKMWLAIKGNIHRIKDPCQVCEKKSWWFHSNAINVFYPRHWIDCKSFNRKLGAWS